MSNLNSKIISTIRTTDLSESTSLESVLKKKFTPALLCDDLVESKSYTGRAIKILRSLIFINENDAFQALFQRAVPKFSDDEIGTFSGEKGYRFYQFRAQYSLKPVANNFAISFKDNAVSKKSCFPSQIPTIVSDEKQHIPLDFVDSLKLHWACDPKELKKFSCLEKDLIVDKELPYLKSVLDPCGRYPLSLASFLRQKSDEIVDVEIKKRLIDASNRLDDLQKVKDRKDLQELSQKAALEVNALNPGEKSLFCGKIPARSPKLQFPKFSEDPFIRDFQSVFFENESSEKLINLIERNLNPLLGAFLEDKQLNNLRQIVKNQLEKWQTPSFDDPSQENSSLFKRIFSSPVQFVRDEAAKLCNEIFNEISLKIKEHLSDKHLLEFERILENDCEVKEIIEEIIRSYLKNSIKDTKKVFSDAITEVGENLPPFATEFMDVVGSKDFGSFEQHFFVEVQKIDNGKFDLYLHLFGKSVLEHQKDDENFQSIFKFKNVDSKQLNQDFFFRFYGYEMLPSWDVEKSHQIDDVFSGLFGPIGDATHFFSSSCAHLAMNQTMVVDEYLKNSGVEQSFEKRFDAFLKLWKIETERPFLKSFAKKIGKQAVDLFERGKLSSGRFKQVFATVECALKFELSDETIQKKKLNHFIPQALVDDIRTFFSSIGLSSTSFEFMQDLLVFGLGDEIKRPAAELLNIIKEDLEPFSVPSKSSGFFKKYHLLNRIWKVVNNTLWFVVNPLGYIINLVKSATASFFLNCFPEQVKIYERSKRKLLIKAFSYLLFTQDQQVAFRKIIENLNSLVFQKKKMISFTIDSSNEPKVLQQITIKPLTQSIPYSSYFSKKVDFKGFDSVETSLTPKNVIEMMKSWILHANGLDDTEKILYLNQKLKTLPLPLKEGGFWSEVSDVNACLVTITELMNCSCWKMHLSLELKNQLIVNLFTIYAIAEKLAKLDPEANLAFYRANPLDLIIWKKRYVSLILDSIVSKRLQDLYTYFDLDFNKEYTNTELNNMGSNYLFFKNSVSYNERPLKDDEYLHSLLNREGLNKKLKDLGVKQNFSTEEKLANLYINPSLESKNNTEKDYKGILPPSYHYLRYVYECLTKTMESLDGYCYPGACIKLHKKSIHESFKRIDSRTHVLLKSFGLDRCFKIDKDSVFRKIPGSITRFSRQDFSYQSFLKYKPIKAINEMEFLTCKKFSKYGPIISWRKDRKNFECVLNAFDFLLNSYLQHEVMNRSINCVSHQELHKELFFVESRDAPVRVLSYFSDNPSKLIEPESKAFLEIGLLKGNNLELQLKTNPKFNEVVDDFFKKSIDYLIEQENFRAVFDLLHLFIMVELKIKKKSSKHNDLIKFLASNEKDQKKRNSLFALIGLQHSLEAPSKMTKDEAKEVACHLCNASTYISSGFIENEELFDIWKETWLVWRSFIKSTCDKDPVFKNRVLKNFCKIKEIRDDSTKSWEGSYPIFNKGKLTINFEGATTNVDPFFHEKVIQKFFLNLFDKEVICSNLTDGKIKVESEGIEVFVDVIEGVYHFYKFEGGTRYELVKNLDGYLEKGRFISYWRQDWGHELIKLKKDAVVRRYTTTGEGVKYIIFSEEIQYDNTRLKCVNPATFKNSLAPIFKFQQEKDVVCFVSSEDLTRLKLIQLPKLNLSFEVKSVKGRQVAVDQTNFPGYHLSKNQKIDNLDGYFNYLVLENDLKEEQILITTDLLSGAFIERLLKTFKVPFDSEFFISHLYSLLEGEFVKNMPKFFPYFRDATGNLTSSDPSAIFHLFLYQLIKGDENSATLYLKRLEQMSKLQPLEAFIKEFAKQLLIIAVIVDSQSLNRIALRLSVLLFENQALFPSIEKNGSTTEDIFLGFVLQVNYQRYLQSGDRGLDSFQELYLIEQMQQAIEPKKLVNLDNFSFIPNIADILDASKEFMLSPIIQERKNFLKTKVSPLLDNQNCWSGKASLAALPKGCLLITDLLRTKKKLDLLNELLNFGSNINCEIIDIEDLKTRFSELKIIDVVSLFFSYFCLVTKHYPTSWKGKKALVEEKRNEFMTTLAYSNGQNLIGLRSAAAILALQIISKASEDCFPKIESLLNKDMQNFLFQVKDSCRKELLKSAFSTAGYNVLKTVAEAFPSPFTQVHQGKLSKKEQVSKDLDKKKATSIEAFQDAPMPKWSEELEEEDRVIEETLFKQTENFFKQLEPIKEESPNLLAPDEKHLTLEKENSYVKRIFKSIDDYFKRKKEIAWDGAVSKEKLYELRNLLEKAVKDLSSVIKKELKEIITFTNNGIDPEIDDFSLMKTKIFKDDSQVDFETLIRCYLNDDKYSLQEVTNLSKEQVEHLFYRLTRFLQWGVRIQQFEKILFKIQSFDSHKKKPDELTQIGKEIAEELCRKRAYSLKGESTRLTRGFLVFEYMTKNMLWRGQADQFSKSLLNSKEPSVVELNMGSGKTYFGIPITDYFIADGAKLPINIWTNAMAHTNTSQIEKQASQIFKQDCYTVKFSRNQTLTSEQMKGRFLIFLRALEERSQVNMCKDDVQALELIWIEKLFGNNLDESFTYMTEILRIIRKRGHGNFDEVHELLRQNSQLNHPLGFQKQLKPQIVKTIAIFVKALLSNEVKNYLNLRKNLQAYLSEEEYFEKVAPLIAKKLSSHSLLRSEMDEEETYKYLMDEHPLGFEKIKSYPNRSLLALVKGLIHVVGPKSLQKVVNVDFGSSMKGNGQYARPYEGNKNPVEDATIESPIEAMLKTCLQQIVNRINGASAIELIESLKIKAEKEAKRGQILKDNTKVALTFKKWCHSKYTLFGHSEKDFKEIEKLLNDNDDAVLTHVIDCISKEITYYKNSLSSNSHNFASMFSSFTSDTGTPSNFEVYPTGTHIHWDDGTIGESVVLLTNMCRAKDSFCEIETDDPKEALNELLTVNFSMEKKPHAFIDSGALFRGINNTEVADAVLKREEYSGVVYFDENKHLLERQKNAKPIPYDQKQLFEKDRFTLFDHSHTYAANVPQATDAVGVLTIGEKITLTALLQAVWRMRGLKHMQQKLRIAINAKTKKFIAPNGPVTIEKIILFAIKNEIEQMKEGNFISDRKEVRNVVRRAILDKVLFCKEYHKMHELLNKYKSLFSNELEDDPYLLFGPKMQKIDSKLALQSLKDQQYSLIKDSDDFTLEEKREIIEKIDKIGSGHYSKEVKICIQGKEHSIQIYDDLGNQQQLVQDQNQNQEVENKIEVEQNLEEQRFVYEEPIADLLPTVKWDPKLDYFSDLNWMKQMKLHLLKEVLSKAKITSICEVLEAFGGNIYMTDNFHGLNKGGRFTSEPVLAQPLTTKQKPIYEVLVVQNAKKNSLILIDQAEANFWREQLQKNCEEDEKNQDVKIALFDLGLNTVIASGKNPIDDSDLKKQQLFLRDTVRLQFLKGVVKYSEEQLQILENWIKKCGAEKMKSAFLEIHRNFGVSCFEGSSIEALFDRLLPMEREEIF